MIEAFLIFGTEASFLANVRFAPEAVIRALAKFHYWGRGVFAKTLADYLPSHETQSRYQRAFYAKGRRDSNSCPSDSYASGQAPPAGHNTSPTCRRESSVAAGNGGVS
jgi:hypothetical protein